MVAALGRRLALALAMVACLHAVAPPIGWGQYALRSGGQPEPLGFAAASLDDDLQAESGTPLVPSRWEGRAAGDTEQERWIEPPAAAVVDAGAYRTLGDDRAGVTTERSLQAGNSDIRLLPPSSERGGRTGGASRGWLTLVSSGSSLLLVLGLFMALAVGWRRSSGGANGSLPRDVLQVLGSSSGGGRERLVLLRLGQRLVLVSQSAGHSQTLCQVDDPLEVDRLAGLCEQQRQGSLSDSFRQVLHGIPERSPVKRRTAGGWFGWGTRIAAGGSPIGGR